MKMIKNEILNRIQLVVMDLDNTLLDDNNKIGDETKHLVKELSVLGVQFSIASRLSFSAVAEYADELQIKIPLITFDGALIQRYPGEKSIFKSELSEKTVLRALNLADRYLLKSALFHDSAIYLTEENGVAPLLLEKFGVKLEQIESYEHFLKGTLEVLIVGEYQNSVKHVAHQMSFPYTFGVRSSFYKSQSQDGTYYLEIKKMGSNKGDGLRRLTKHLKIKMEKTAVIGDWYNDKPLFDTDALKIAVANAIPELKKMADIVTKRSNNEDGVAEFLKMLLQSKNNMM